MRREDFRPFVARAIMETSLSAENPIPFDGILADVLFRAGTIGLRDEIPCLAYEDGIAKASCGVLVEAGLAGISRTTMTTAKGLNLKVPGAFQDGLDFGDAKKWKIHDMSPYRSQLRSYPLLGNVREVVFQAVGDVEAVRRILEDVPSIGLQRRRGVGAVAEWRFETCGADPAEAGFFSGDRLLRRLPLETVLGRYGRVPEGANRGRGAVRTPLWGPGAVEVDVAVPSLRGMTANYDRAYDLLSC